MEILNFTGREIGLTARSGMPMTVLYPDGHAKCEILTTLKLESDRFIPIYNKVYGKIIGLPAPDPNRETYYIVNEDVAQAKNRVRNDLLTVNDPISFKGTVYYKVLAISA